MSHVALVDPARQVPAYDRALAAALARAGWTVTLASAPRVHDELPPPEGVEERTAFGRALRPRSPSAGDPPAPTAGAGLWLRRLRRVAGYPAEWPALARALRAEGGAPLVHAQWALLPPFEALVHRRLRRAGIPVAYTVHNVLPHEPRPLQEHRWRAVYRAADALIVHSEASAARLRRLLGRPGPPIHVIPMGPFSPAVPLPRPAARRALELPPAGSWTLFFGLVRPYKGLDDLLAAWAQVVARQPSARLLVAGPVPGGRVAAATVRRRIAALGLADRVLWRPGYVPESRVASLLAASDLVALPYRETDDSAVLALARGHGRAVVATDVGGLREGLGDGGRLAPPGDVDGLAEVIVAMLADPRAREAHEAAQRQASRAWTWADVARSTIDVYRSLPAKAVRVGEAA